MDRKKRRRSIRNLRRQSLSSFCEDGDITVNNDTLMIGIQDNVESNDVFGTVWVESNEESLKEKRKRRRSSVLLKKPLLRLESSSPEIEILRHDAPVKSPQFLTLSPELVKINDKVSSPLSITPSNSFNSSTNNLDMGFVGEVTTPTLEESNTTTKKQFSFTPDVDLDMLESPMQDVYSSSLTPEISTHESLTDNISVSLNSEILQDSELTVTPQNSELDLKPSNSDQLLMNSDIETPKNSCIPKSPVEGNENKENSVQEEGGTHISPSLIESLDNLASGAMGLFNSLVRRISKSNSNKKTPKKPKIEKKVEKDFSDSYIEDFLLNTRAKIEERKSEKKKLEEMEVLQESEMEELNQENLLMDGNLEKRMEEDLNEGLIEMEEEPLPLNDELNNNTQIIEEYEKTHDLMEPLQNTGIQEKESSDNFSMQSLVESIDHHSEHQNVTTKRRSKRKSADFSLELDASLGESDILEETSLRKSRRNRRKSLEIYQAGVAHEKAHPEQYLISRYSLQDDENLEDLYQNKNYKAPLEKTWETIYESPNKSKQFISKKKFRRVIDFDGFAPAKFKRRLQKANKNGWTNICSRELSDSFVQSKLSSIYSYLDTSSDLSS